MKTFFVTLLLCLSMGISAFADQDTTVLTMQTKCAKATGYLPFLDGTNEPDYAHKANGLIMKTMREMVKTVGNAGTFSYSVQLNRPSLVSVLLKVQNKDKECYQALNLDLTNGQDFTVFDFFVNDNVINEVLGKYESFLFTEDGVFLRDKKWEKYSKFIPFSKILTSVRIGQAGRLFQIAKLTRDSENKMLSIKKNRLFAIKLDSNPTTGFKWDAELPADGKIIKVGSSFIIPRQEEERVGVPGSEILFFSPVVAGKYDIKMNYKRSWEKHYIDSFNFTVNVRE